jgi:hypothetical protein
MKVLAFDLVELLHKVLVLGVVLVGVEAACVRGYRKEVGMISWTWQARSVRESSWL